MVDYSLYLVTDSTPAILGDRQLCEVVDAALRGGVTCVQYRDKTRDTGALVEMARKLHEVTRRHGVPLLINDRVDVVLAVGCEGVHVGQDDMELSLARKLLGPKAIVGVSVSTLDEALTACRGGADYLGIGSVFTTATKTNTKTILGVDGLRELVSQIRSHAYTTSLVCIGGISETTAPQLIQGVLDLQGFAVVSAIVASPDAQQASQNLRRIADKLGKSAPLSPQAATFRVMASHVIRAVAVAKPLSHNMTNLVVQNFAANVALAVGASPIMANYGEEAADLAKLGGALVINMGTVTPEGIENYIKALKAYNREKRPVVFDPVGAGATSIRRAAVKTILSAGKAAVIKGNEGEIQTVFGSLVQQRGVDSASTLTPIEKVSLVRQLAAREHCVVLMTGKIDYVSDGSRTFSISNGHEYLATVTGTGCVLGTTISAMLAAWEGDELLATVAAVLLFEIAAELAVEGGGVEGPGSFVPRFLDALWRLRREVEEGREEWMARARIMDEAANA